MKDQNFEKQATSTLQSLSSSEISGCRRKDYLQLRRNRLIPTFKKRNLEKILAGQKTQTRRTHKQEWKVGKIYGIRDRWFTKPHAWILITRKFRQKLGDITLEDAKKEGFRTIAEFREEWIKIHGTYDPEQIVIVYEFKLIEKSARERAS